MECTETNHVFFKNRKPVDPLKQSQVKPVIWPDRGKSWRRMRESFLEGSLPTILPPGSIRGYSYSHVVIDEEVKYSEYLEMKRYSQNL